MIVMQYAKNGSLLTYLDQNINKLTWKRKLQYLDDIALHLSIIHEGQLVHCDLHGGNIVLTDDKFDNDIQPVICDFGLSKSASSSPTTSSIQGVLPYIVPEVLYSRASLLKSRIFILIIMHQIANGESPFRDWSSDDKCLAIRICDGLRPEMPDSAPEEYKKLAERCCDADPNKRPKDGGELHDIIGELIKG